MPRSAQWVPTGDAALQVALDVEKVVASQEATPSGPANFLPRSRQSYLLPTGGSSPNQD